MRRYVSLIFSPRTIHRKAIKIGERHFHMFPREMQRTEARCEGATEIFLAAQQLTSLSCFTILGARARYFCNAISFLPLSGSPNKIDRWLRTRCLVDHPPRRRICLLDTLPPNDALLAASKFRIESVLSAPPGTAQHSRGYISEN